MQRFLKEVIILKIRVTELLNLGGGVALLLLALWLVLAQMRGVSARVEWAR